MNRKIIEKGNAYVTIFKRLEPEMILELIRKYPEFKVLYEDVRIRKKLSTISFKLNMMRVKTLKSFTHIFLKDSDMKRKPIQQRIREYGKLEAFGWEIKDIACLLGSERFILFLIGFPAGTVLGAARIRGIYQHYEKTGAIDLAISYQDSVAIQDVLRNAALILTVLFFIILLVTIQLKRMTIVETIHGKAKDSHKGMTDNGTNADIRVSVEGLRQI